MNQKYVRSKLHWIFFGFIIFSICILSIGYASFDLIKLNISGEVLATPQSEVYITNIVYDSSNNADLENSHINNYYQSLMQSTIALGNSTASSITYSITVYNSSDKVYSFKEVEYSDNFYDNSNIVFELDGLKEWDTLESKHFLTFSITFHYLNNIVPEDKILNSYLNFKFILGVTDDTGIVTDNKKVMIYNAQTDNVMFDITNINDFAVNLNLKIDDLTLQTLSLNPSQSIAVDLNLSDKLTSLQPNKEYTVAIEQTAPYAINKNTTLMFQVIPTITNYDLGLTTAGSKQNPYILYKIEDLVRLSKNVNSGTTFANSYIKLASDLDFKNESDYYKFDDLSFGDLNGDTTDSNQILNEMTTGNGFIMIGSSENNSFQGTFDGDNNNISNLYIKKMEDLYDTPYGLFRAVKNATIINTSLYGSYTFNMDGSAFAGNIYGTTKFLNCHSHVDITNSEKDKSIGGLIGTLQPNSNVTIENCSNHGTIVNNSGAAGGLVGFVISSTVTLSNSYNAGNVSVLGVYGADQFAAGLVVKDNSGGGIININNCYNTGTITCKGSGNDNVGGLVSLSVGTLNINSSYNCGNVNGTTNVGGILGSHRKLWGAGTPGKTSIVNSYNVGIISGSTCVGGIIGQDTGNNFDISKAYYLQNADNSLLNVGSVANNKSCSRTENYMKSSEFVTLLGSPFIADSSPFKNHGYPILVIEQN